MLALFGFVLGAAVPFAVVSACYVRAGAWREFVYCFVTYTRSVYMGPVTKSVAAENTYWFLKNHGTLLVVTMLCVAWGVAKHVSKLRGIGLSARVEWVASYARSAPATMSSFQLLLALGGAMGMCRPSMEHYLVTMLPWLGMMLGIMVDDALGAGGHFGTAARAARVTAAVAVVFVGTSYFMRGRTLAWHDRERQQGGWWGVDDDPLTRHVRANVAPEKGVVVWGAQPEIYTDARRRSLTRYISTTYVAGVVPWIWQGGAEAEERRVVPHSREIFLAELKSARPEMIIDVPDSMMGRSIRNIPEFDAFLTREYCFDRYFRGHPGRVASVWRLRTEDSCDENDSRRRRRNPNPE